MPPTFAFSRFTRSCTQHTFIQHIYYKHALSPFADAHLHATSPLSHFLRLHAAHQVTTRTPTQLISIHTHTYPLTQLVSHALLPNSTGDSVTLAELRNHGNKTLFGDEYCSVRPNIIADRNMWPAHFQLNNQIHYSSANLTN